MINFDPSRIVPMYLRVGMDGSKTINFVDASGIPYNISGLTFQIDIYERIGGSLYLSWTEGSELSKPSSSSLKITFTDTASSGIRVHDYFYILKRTDGSGLVKTWFNGPLHAHEGEFDGVTETTTVTIDENGTSVTVSITDSADQRIGINTQTDDYTLALSDAYNLVEMDKATANNLTIPNNTDVALPIGSYTFFLQKGVGQTTIVAGSGVTLRYTTGLKVNAQYGKGTILKIGTNEFHISGDLEA